MIRALTFAVLLAGAAAPALAQEAPGSGDPEAQDRAQSPLGFNLAISTDYVFRGITQSGGDPAVSAGADYETGAAYAGVWASNADFGEGDELELDLYGGWRPEVGGVTLDLGALFYAFPASDTGYLEAKAAASRAVGPLTASAALYWAPDTKGREGEGLYYEAGGELALGGRLTLSGALGRQEDDEFGAYNTWNLGAEVGLTDRISFDARYWDTDTRDFGRDAEARLVAALKAEF